MDYRGRLDVALEQGTGLLQEIGVGRSIDVEFYKTTFASVADAIHEGLDAGERHLVRLMALPVTEKLLDTAFDRPRLSDKIPPISLRLEAAYLRATRDKPVKNREFWEDTARKIHVAHKACHEDYATAAALAFGFTEIAKYTDTERRPPVVAREYSRGRETLVSIKKPWAVPMGVRGGFVSPDFMAAVIDIGVIPSYSGLTNMLRYQDAPVKDRDLPEKLRKRSLHNVDTALITRDLEKFLRQGDEAIYPIVRSIIEDIHETDSVDSRGFVPGEN